MSFQRTELEIHLFGSYGLWIGLIDWLEFPLESRRESPEKSNSSSALGAERCGQGGLGPCGDGALQAVLKYGWMDRSG